MMKALQLLQPRALSAAHPELRGMLFCQQEYSTLRGWTLTLMIKFGDFWPAGLSF